MLYKTPVAVRFPAKITSSCCILLAEFNVYIIIFADQVFIDPTFFGIFVCGPLQFLVVNVCTLISKKPPLLIAQDTQHK